MLKNGIIFGKFYPLHIGHINFINESKNKVDKLYVVLCSDSNRDKKLYAETDYRLTPDKRYNIINEEFQNDDKVEILRLDETGITFYPNGWKEWSNAVDKMLEKEKIKIDTVFTNEAADVENYKIYFSKLKNVNENFRVELNDPERKNIKISATEIRRNPEKNKRFLTPRGKHYLVFSPMFE